MIAIPSRVVALVPNLGRSNDNEVVTAVRMIERVLRSENLDFHDLAAALQASGSRPATAKGPWRPGQPSHVDMARACLAVDGGRLTARERVFLADIRSRGHAWKLSPKQVAWLSQIFERLHGKAAA